MELARASSGESNRFQFQHRLASGEVRDVEVYSSPIVAGERTLLASVIHDVTEHRQTQRALQQAADRFRGLMATTMEGVWILDHEGLLADVNDHYLEMSGYTRDDLLRMGVAGVEAGLSAEEIVETIEAGR